MHKQMYSAFGLPTVLILAVPVAVTTGALIFVAANESTVPTPSPNWAVWVVVWVGALTGSLSFFLLGLLIGNAIARVVLGFTIRATENKIEYYRELQDRLKKEAASVITTAHEATAGSGPQSGGER